MVGLPATKSPDLGSKFTFQILTLRSHSVRAGAVKPVHSAWRGAKILSMSWAEFAFPM